MKVACAYQRTWYAGRKVAQWLGGRRQRLPAAIVMDTGVTANQQNVMRCKMQRRHVAGQPAVRYAVMRYRIRATSYRECCRSYVRDVVTG